MDPSAPVQKTPSISLSTSNQKTRYIQNISSKSTRIYILLKRSRIDHMLGHKTSLNKVKTEIISSVFSDHNGMKLEINNRRKAGKFPNAWKLNTLLNN